MIVHNDSTPELSTRCVYAGEGRDEQVTIHPALYNRPTFGFDSTADVLDVVESRTEGSPGGHFDLAGGLAHRSGSRCRPQGDVPPSAPGAISNLSRTSGPNFRCKWGTRSRLVKPHVSI